MRLDRKLKDAEKLGVKAENFIITKDVAAVTKKYNKFFDLIICTSFQVSLFPPQSEYENLLLRLANFPFVQADLPLDSLYFKLLRAEGALVLCGLPEEKLPAFYGHALVGKAITLA